MCLLSQISTAVFFIAFLLLLSGESLWFSRHFWGDRRVQETATLLPLPCLSFRVKKRIRERAELGRTGDFAEIQDSPQWWAQEYVHDLNLFVTVQFLEETPVVPSLGKLCEDHGYSYEWVSGQKPRWTKEEKTTFFKMDNFVPLVVPRVIHQFWQRFVVNIDIAGFVFKKSSPGAK